MCAYLVELTLLLALILFSFCQITERLRDPRGIRRGGLAGIGPRNFGANGGRGFGRTGPQRGFVRQVIILTLDRSVDVVVVYVGDELVTVLVLLLIGAGRKYRP